MPRVSLPRLSGRGLFGGLLAATLLLLGLGQPLVWGPLWLHFHVDPGPLDAAAVERHRTLPPDALLATVAEASMMTDHPLRGEAAAQAARRILAGELVLPALPALPLEPGFVPAQLERGVPVQQVFVASLVVPDLLLRANEYQPNPAFLRAAQRYVQDFARYESAAAFSTGLLFNAHAVANRAAVLARLWRQVRATADDALARDLHRLALRTGALLVKPAHFIASTNQGVMQNVALLQLAATFPGLAQADGWRECALKRLAAQRPMYIGADGGVLEHAAGYHFHGVVLSGYVVRLLQAMDQPVPPDWLQAHEAARAYLAALQRPDGSLPAIGNTYRYRWQLPPLVQADATAWARALQGRASYGRVFPVTGTAVWWDAEGGDAQGVQTVVPWGWFAQHGHARAQEMSLLVWSAGTDWSTNTGYWPNSDEAGFETAAGWDGGNAPHVVGEPGHSVRRTSVLAQLQQGALRVLDLERVVDGGPRLRRQILQWQGRQWLVLDTYQDALARPLRVLWTGAPETTQQPLGERAFGLRREGTAARFTVAVDGSDGVSATALRGSHSPFGGWVAFDRKAVAAPAVDARLQSPRGWMLASLHLDSAAPGGAPLRGQMQRYAGPEDWSLQWPTPSGRVALTRQGGTLTLDDPAWPEGAHTLALAPGPATDEQLAAIQAADDALRREYPRFRTAEADRRRRSMQLIGVWALACAALWIWRRRSLPAAGRVAARVRGGL